jgi:hypothetical protein
MAYRHHPIPEANIFDGSCPPPCASIAQLIRGAWLHTSCGSARQFGFPLKATRRNHPCESAAKCGKGLGAVEPKNECAKSDERILAPVVVFPDYRCPARPLVREDVVLLIYLFSPCSSEHWRKGSIYSYRVTKSARRGQYGSPDLHPVIEANVLSGTLPAQSLKCQSQIMYPSGALLPGG